MKTFLVFGLCALFSNVQQNRNDNLVIVDIYDTSNATFIKTDTLRMDEALLRWRTDSLGCLQQRTLGLAQELMKKLNIVGRHHNEVIQILGKPNVVYYQNLYVGSLKKDGVFLRLGYYLQQECEQGKIIEEKADHNMVYLTIDVETNKVVSSSF